MVASAHSLTARTWPREAITSGRKPAAPRTRLGRTREALLDAGILLVFVYALPFVIILMAAPVVLALKLLLWVGGVR